jgi:hypothetical protein
MCRRKIGVVEAGIARAKSYLTLFSVDLNQSGPSEPTLVFDLFFLLFHDDGSLAGIPDRIKLDWERNPVCFTAANEITDYQF